MGVNGSIAERALVYVKPNGERVPVTLRLGTRATAVRAGAGGDGAHVVELDGLDPIEAHQIMVAIGRDIPLEGLGLETIGVEAGGGRVERDERLLL